MRFDPARPVKRRAIAPYAALVAVTALVPARRAAAQETAAAHPTARLAYSVAPGVVDCPEAAEIHTAIAARLGYDPIDPSATTRVATTIAPAPRAGLLARIEVRDASGRVVGLRTLRSQQGDCRELAQSVAFAISIAIDPVRASQPAAAPAAPPPPPPPPPSPPSSAPATPPPSPPPTRAQPLAPAAPSAPRPAHAEPARLRVRVFAGVVGSALALPSVSLGPLLGAGLEWNWLVVDLDARVDVMPAAQPAPGGGSYSATRWLATIAPCARARWGLSGCVLLSLGALVGAGIDLDGTPPRAAPYAAGGARVAFDLPLGRVLALRAHLDALAVFTPLALLTNHATAWSTPIACVTLGVGALVRF